MIGDSNLIHNYNFCFKKKKNLTVKNSVFSIIADMYDNRGLASSKCSVILFKVSCVWLIFDSLTHLTCMFPESVSLSKQ